MLLPMLVARGHIAAMAIVAVLIFSERLEPATRPCWGCRGTGKAISIAATQVCLRVFGAAPRLDEQLNRVGKSTCIMIIL